MHRHIYFYRRQVHGQSHDGLKVLTTKFHVWIADEVSGRFWIISQAQVLCSDNKIFVHSPFSPQTLCTFSKVTNNFEKNTNSLLNIFPLHRSEIHIHLLWSMCACDDNFGRSYENSRNMAFCIDFCLHIHQNIRYFSTVFEWNSLVWHRIICYFWYSIDDMNKLWSTKVRNMIEYWHHFPGVMWLIVQITTVYVIQMFGHFSKCK